MSRSSTDTREALLDAALATFARAGVRAARLEDVAEAAGLTRAALYYHFHSKDELLAALLDRAITRLGRCLADAAATGGLRDLVTAMLRTYLDDQHLFRLLLTELWAPVEPSRFMRRIEQEILAPVTDRLARAVAAGEIRTVEPRVGALALFGQVSAVALGRITQNEPFDLDTLNAELSALVDAAFAPLA